ncbi:hypothetical protein ACIBCE_54350, partial [Streptomyces sp. NPDC051554]
MGGQAVRAQRRPRRRRDSRPVERLRRNVETDLLTLRNYIDGEFRDAADGRTTEVVNPATGEAYATA